MASTNKTTNFELPQWISTDKPTFEGDLNSAFLIIDNTMQSNKTTSETGNANANSALEKIGNLTLLETTVKDNLVNAINEIVSGGITPSEIGNLSDLTTSAKNNIVSAINEVDSLAKELQSDNTNIWSQITNLRSDITPLENNINNLVETVGNLSSLTTTAKDNIVDAVNEVNGNKADLLTMSLNHGTINSTQFNWTGQSEQPTSTSGAINYVMTSNQLVLYGNVRGSYATDGSKVSLTIANPMPTFNFGQLAVGLVTAIYDDESTSVVPLRISKSSSLLTIGPETTLKTGAKTMVFTLFPIPITNLE